MKKLFIQGSLVTLLLLFCGAYISMARSDKALSKPPVNYTTAR